MFGVPPFTPATLHVADRGNSQRRARNDWLDLRGPRSVQHARIDTDASVRRLRVHRIGDEQFARVAPQVVERSLRATMALVGAVAQA